MNLSKSRFIKGMQCQKLLWLLTHKKEALSEPDMQQTERFSVERVKAWNIENFLNA